ncbi:MAG: hypothetical protein RSB61_00550 [Clostridia bacterium]
MPQDLTKEILIAIKSDNAEAFGGYVSAKENLSICYGKFPILSLCYLFGSKKIIKLYENELLNITKYSKKDDDFGLYCAFRKKAKKSLRLYLAADKIVSPLEMLALLGEESYLAKVYPRASKSQAIMDNLNRIFAINYNKNIDQKANAVAIPRSPLSNQKRLLFIIVVVFCCLALAFSSVTWAVAQSNFGGGGVGEKFAVKIKSEEQLRMAFAKGKDNFVFECDLELSSEWTAQDFDGSLNGGGHTLKVNGKIADSFVKKNSGTIKNINFDFGAQNESVESDKSYIAVENAGKIENVTLKLSGELQDKSPQEELFVSGFVLDNNGSINACATDININMVGDGVGNAYLGAFAARNGGNITDCVINAGSKLTTDTVDLAGIVVTNLAKGAVKGCVNNADITQSTNNAGWSPNTSGIVLSNLGAVENCVNNGNIVCSSSVLLGKDKDERATVFAGGIVCVNGGSVKKCKNVGSVTANSQDLTIYLGGIVAVNGDAKAVIDSCGSWGKLTLNSNEPLEREEGKGVYDHFVFAGGVAAMSNGDIKNCFSVAEWQTTVKDLVFVGGILGEVDTTSGNAKSLNNVFLDRNGIKYGVSTALYVNILGLKSLVLYSDENFDVLEQIFLSNCEKVYTLDQMKLKEVFWE